MIMAKRLGKYLIAAGMGLTALMIVANTATDLVLGAIMVGLVYLATTLESAD